MSWRSWGFRVVAVILGLGLPLAAAEGYLRFTGSGGGFYEPDPILGSRLIPNGAGRWRKACFDVPIRINSRGLRDVEHTLEKRPGTQRIAVLGDSLVEALQVPLEQTFPRLLEGLLNGGGGEPRAEALNFGASGYGTDQMYLSLNHRVAAYRPDVVVLVFTIANDVRNNSPDLERRVSSYPKPFFRLDADGRLVPIPFEASAPGTAGPLGKVKAMLRNLRLYDFVVAWAHANPRALSFLARMGLVHGVPAQPGGGDGPGDGGGGGDIGHLDLGVYRRDADPHWAEAWRVTEALIRATRDAGARMGAAFILVSIPASIELAPPGARAGAVLRGTPDAFDLAGPRRRLQRLADDEGFDHVSMFQDFSQELVQRGRKLEDLFFWCDGHLTPLAHNLVADAIAGRLRQREMVRGPSRP